MERKKERGSRPLGRVRAREGGGVCAHGRGRAGQRQGGLPPALAPPPPLFGDKKKKQERKKKREKDNMGILISFLKIQTEYAKSKKTV